jgi:hypothetical protein
MTDTPWRDGAACTGHDPATFTEPAGPDDERDALATCAGCPVAADCLDTALAIDRNHDLGVWGGTTLDTRNRIRDGHLTVEDALALNHARRPGITTDGRVELHADPYGDYTDTSGRILVTPLPAGGYLTLVGGRPVARTDTLTDAITTIAQTPDQPAAQRPAVASPPPLLDVQLDPHGDYTDTTGRITITRTHAKTTPWTVLLDDRPIDRAETLNLARAAAHQALDHQDGQKTPARRTRSSRGA